MNPAALDTKHRHKLLLGRTRDYPYRGGSMIPAKSIFWIVALTLVGTSVLVGALASVLPTVAGAEAGQESQVPHPAGAGLLLVATAADTSRGFRWLDWPLQQRRLLVWETGMISVPDSLEELSVGREGLAFPYQAGLAGISEGRQLVFSAGSYTIEEALWLSDGRLQAFFSRGEIVIESGRIVYQLPPEEAPDPRANYVFLVAIVLLSVVLLARARARVKRR